MILTSSACSDFEQLISEDQALFAVSPNNDGTALLTSYKGTKSTLSIPAIISGMEVVGISDGVFADMKFVRSVKLPESVSTIGASAFSGCSSLESINLGRVREIGSDAFSGCSSLTEADLVSASDIAERAFSGCTAMTELTLGSAKSVHVGEHSFSSCSSLEIIRGGRSAKYEPYAFSDCVSLKEVTFSGKARLAGEVFTGCSMLYTARFESDDPPQYLEKWISAVPTFPEWTTIVYSDNYLKTHRRVIYSDNDDNTRLFTYVLDGEGGGGDAVSIEQSCPVDPANGKECIDCVMILPEDVSAAGWQFMNSGYDEDGHIAPANGYMADCGTDLTGAQTLVFYARSEKGGERITFFFGGCGYQAAAAEGEENNSAPYPDSCDRVFRRFTLSDNWQRFTIDVSQYDLSYIQCGFGFSCIHEDCGSNAEIYLDDIYFEGNFN